MRERHILLKNHYNRFYPGNFGAGNHCKFLLSADCDPVHRLKLSIGLEARQFCPNTFI